MQDGPETRLDDGRRRSPPVSICTCEAEGDERAFPNGNTIPLGFVVFPFFLENAMNLELLSCQQLEAMLLGERSMHLHAAPLALPRKRQQSGSGDSRSRTIKRHLAVARELLIRRQHADLVGRCLLDGPRHAKDYLRLYFAGLEHEVFVAVMLDCRHRVLECRELFRGTLTQTSVYPREVVKAAMEAGAGAILLAHNHPSGSCDASSADELLTAKLKAALDLVDVRVIDHLVFGGGNFYSFAEQGVL